jgi:hypothetical protein
VDRILWGVSATLSQTVSVAELGTDPNPDAATVTITRADGTPVVTDATVVNGPNGGFTYTLTPAQTALLDTLTATWTFTLNGFVQHLTSQVEIVGGYHFGLSQLRTMQPLSDQNAYSTAKLLDARTLAETTIEQACQRAFVPRYSIERVDSFQSWPFPDVRAIRSAVNMDGTILTGAALTDAFNGIYPWHSYRYHNRSWMVGVEYGMDSCPADVARASMLLARSYLLQGPEDDRATGMSNEFGSYTLVTPGVRGAYTNLPSVNALIDQYRLVALG